MEAIAIICDGLGAGPVESYRSDITKVLTAIFTGEAACILEVGEEEVLPEGLEGE